jgi:hypothetical protein
MSAGQNYFKIWVQGVANLLLEANILATRNRFGRLIFISN